MPKKKDYFPLLNGCYRTEISVFPSNWKTVKSEASLKKEWYIWYRFYDPRFPGGKPVKVRGMNKYQTLDLRIKNTKQLLEIEHNLIDNKHYNPITNTFMQPSTVAATVTTPVKKNRPVTPDTGFIAALDWAYENVKCEPTTLDNIKSTLASTWHAAASIGIEYTPIGNIEKPDIRMVLDEIGKIKNDQEKLIAEFEGRPAKDVWTASAFNHNKGYLGMLYKVLGQYDVYKVNPLQGIDKWKTTKKVRDTLNDEDFESICDELASVDYYFSRFMRIFRRSGSRRTEILAVKDTDVQLNRYRFLVTVKKDNVEKEQWKTIDPDVLRLWEEIMNEAAEIRRKMPNNKEPLFLFNIGLKPRFRESPIREEQVTKRWMRYVKRDMGVDEDLYSVKHLNTTSEINKLVDAAIRQARRKVAKRNSHNSTRMVEQVYDVNTDRREAIIRKLKYQKRRKAVVVRHGKSA